MEHENPAVRRFVVQKLRGIAAQRCRAGGVIMRPWAIEAGRFI
jgi:hypothetical protein